MQQGRNEITKFVESQPEELRQVAQEAAQDAQGKFDQLDETVDAKQNEIVDSLAQKYVEKLQALDSQLEAMKEAEKGLLAKAGDLIDGVIKTIGELKDLLLNTLQRAAGAVMKILQNPIEFLGNLLSAVGQGLRQFAGNIGTHLQQGLISWLTGALAGGGIQLPASWDLQGIFSLVMQVLGLTYAQIRARIVQALGPIGEQVIGALEQAWEVFQIIQNEGLAGLWHFIADQVGDLQAMVLDQIKEMVISQVIRAGIEWLVGILGGPAGAFIKAVQAIIRVVTWFVNNAARLASLVNSVLDSVMAIASGDIGGAAGHIEQSLAKALPSVISFLADLLGLGGISQKVQQIITKVRAPIEKAITWLVQKAVALGKKLWGMLTGKGKGDKPKDGPVDDSDAGRQQRLSSAVQDAEQLIDAPGTTLERIRSGLPAIKEKYDLTSLDLVKDEAHTYHVVAKINPQLPGEKNKVWTEAELKEMTAAAQDIAGKIKENEAKKPGEIARFRSNPIAFLSDKKTPKGKDNHYRGQLGPVVEGAATPAMEELAKEGGLTLLRNVGLQFVDASGKPIGAVRTELDFLLLGPSNVVEIVSAKLDTTKVSPKTDRAALAHFQNVPLAPPAAILAYIQANPQAFGTPSGYRDVAGVNVSHSQGQSSLANFRSQYLSSAVVSTIDVKGVGPADAPDKGYTMRFTEAEIVKKVADLIDTML